MLSTQAADGLIIDAGDALFRLPSRADDEDRRRASLVMSVMGRLGTKVMGVGLKDLSGGPEFLKKIAAEAKVKLTSANLKENGKSFADAFVTMKVGDRTVTVISVIGSVPPEWPALTMEEPLAALQKTLKTVGKRDVTMVLAAMDYQSTLKLASELKGQQVDFIIDSAEFRGTSRPQQIDSIVLLGGGQKGQQIGKLELFGKGTDAWFDQSIAERAQEQLAHLDSQLQTLEERMKKVTDAAAKKEFEGTLKEMRARRAEQKKVVDQPSMKGTRSFRHQWLFLDKNVADDPKLKAEVLLVEPSYEGTH